MAKIKVKILKDGSIETEVDGVVGQSCTEVTKFLEVAVGGSTKQQKEKDEYWQNEHDPLMAMINNK